MTSIASAPKGTVVSASASCPAGKLLLGGGALVSTTAKPDRAVLAASYPSSTTAWSANGVATGSLGAGKTMTVTAYALCSL